MTGVSKIDKTLIFFFFFTFFDHIIHLSPLPLTTICVTAQELPACCPHCDCGRSAMLKALRDQWTHYYTVNTHS